MQRMADGGRPKTARNMRVLLIGAPGAGKGTQATKIAEHFGLTHISSGELLRQHIAEGTTIGRQVQEYVARGDLVPDAIRNRSASRSRPSPLRCRTGPRTGGT